MSEINLTKANFTQEVTESSVPVLVDFWATWCAPCRMLSPVIAELAQEYEGRLKVCKVNVDEEGDLVAQFRVMSIPTLLYFKDGNLVSSSVGFLPKEELIRKFELDN